MYIAWAKAQFKINSHRCWNWQLCISDRLSITHFRLSHIIGILFLTQFLWHETNLLDIIGSWRCWFSLEKRSSIPARSTIIYRQWGQVSRMLADHRDGLSNSSFCLILDSSVGSSAGIQSAGNWVSETLWVRILHSAEEENLSPFDSNIACLCQSIEINNNKYVCMYACMCWNRHMCIPDSVVQCSLGHVIGVAFFYAISGREAHVLDKWQLAELPQSGGREFDPRRVHDNLSVPLWVYMRFPVPEHHNKTNKYVYHQRQGAVQY